jgi:hypothetical protein
MSAGATASRCVDLLLFLTKSNMTIRYTNPVVGESTDPKPPPWPADDSVHMLEVKIAAFASTSVRDAMGRWLEERRQFMHATWMIDQPTLGAEGWRLAEQHRNELYAVNNEIRELVNAELNV